MTVKTYTIDPNIPIQQDLTVEELIDLGNRFREQKDDCHWALGDIVHQMFRETVSGKPALAVNTGIYTMKQYANDINIKPSSLSEYKAVSEFYPSQYREFENLSWSHYNLAMREGKRINPDDPFAAKKLAQLLLQDASREQWSINRMRFEFESRFPKDTRKYKAMLLIENNRVAWQFTDVETGRRETVQMEEGITPEELGEIISQWANQALHSEMIGISHE